MLENIGNFMTRLLMDRLERNLGGRIQTTPLPQNRYWSLLLTAQCMHCAVLCPGFMGCNGQKNIHTFDETLSLYATMLQIISGKKTGNFNTKTLRR